MSEIRQIQVDGVNYDLVITEDEVAATRAEQAAAQSAASATQSQQHANSASGSAVTAYGYMEAAEDAADRAEAIVGGQFVSYGQTQSLTDAQKTTAKDNIGVTESGNKNLLDNWYFIDPVNSRGLSYYTDTNYTIDRWRFWESGSSLTLTSNGVVFANSGTINGLFQYLEPKRFQSLYGKTITISAIIDGTLYSQTGTASDNCDITCVISGNTYFKYYCNGSDGHFRFNVADGSSITIKAAKLEIGSISTLEKDAAPNKGEELTKCISVVPLYGDTCTNTGYGRTNPNLLDNWWFTGGKLPVNQRGKTTYDVNGYNVDRWICYASSGSVTVSENGITAPAYGVMTQALQDYTLYNGKTLTFSILYDSGMEVGTAVLDLSGSTIFIANAGMAYITSGGLVQFYKEAQYTVKAVKLEIGSVSTLAQDGEPNYGEELTKCIYSKADGGDPYANNGFGRSNRNLLDNWYFVGGGSQNGDGYFPINQRGLTTYSSSGRNLDRWSNDAELVLYSDGIASTGGAVYQGFVQEKVVQLLGKTLTASLLFNDGTLISGTATMPTSLPASMTLIPYNGAYGLCSILDPAWNQLFRFDGSTFGSKHLVAAKLEIGTVSTLANDILPDFSIEYEKCRYYLRYIPLTRYPIAIDGANAYMTMIGMPMRGVPSPSLITAGGVRDAGGQSTITSATVTGYDKKIATVQFALSASRSYVVGYIYDTVLCLSAEI